MRLLDPCLVLSFGGAGASKPLRDDTEDAHLTRYWCEQAVLAQALLWLAFYTRLSLVRRPRLPAWLPSPFPRDASLTCPLNPRSVSRWQSMALSPFQSHYIPLRNSCAQRGPGEVCLHLVQILAHGSTIGFKRCCCANGPAFLLHFPGHTACPPLVRRGMWC